MIRRLRIERARCGEHGQAESSNRPAVKACRKHHGSPCSKGFTAGLTAAISQDQCRMQTQAAASRPATMPFLAFNRKDTGGESIGRLTFEAADLANNTGKRIQCGGIVAGAARL